jgi:hypothetical protein
MIEPRHRRQDDCLVGWRPWWKGISEELLALQVHLQRSCNRIGLGEGSILLPVQHICPVLNTARAGRRCRRYLHDWIAQVCLRRVLDYLGVTVESLHEGNVRADRYCFALSSISHPAMANGRFSRELFAFLTGATQY